MVVVPRLCSILVVALNIFLMIDAKQKIGKRDWSDEARKKFQKTQSPNSSQEKTQTFWRENAHKTLENRLNASKNLNTNMAKNVIIFMGDGMSLETVAATRVYMGNSNVELSFEKFPYVGLSKTYCVNRQVADSACSATAYLSGVKANYGTIGVNANVKRYNCEADLNTTSYTESIAKWAQDDCRATGIVTTSRVTHASPAGVYAHTANRDWENDREILDSKCDPSKNTDIAKQLVRWDVGRNLKVILGCGRGQFRSKKAVDEEKQKGYRTDGLDLIKEWQEEQSKRGKANFVWNKKQLSAIDVDKTDYLLGLFETDHCKYNLEIEKKKLKDLEPSLTDMTEIAIKMLSKEKNGYFLFVESAKIDMAHHKNRAYKALDETAEFSRAIERAVNITNDEDTLIVVTSDHSHTMSYNGYPDRDDSIFSINRGESGVKYTTLSYANGRGYEDTYKKKGGLKKPNKFDYSDIDRRFPATVPLSTETHGGSDVGVFASGPSAHLFVGNYDQNNIPLLMAYAAKLGPYGEGKKNC